MPVPSQTLLSLMIILREAKRPILSTQKCLTQGHTV